MKNKYDEEWYWYNRQATEAIAYNNYISGLDYTMARPSIVYKPKLFIDGNQWCALLGDNLQEGVAGFGKSPEKAMSDFDKNFAKDL